MDFDMKKWIQDMIRADVKKPLPVLSFPGIQITGNTVEEIVGNGTLQADCMEAVAKKFDMAAVLSLWNLLRRGGGVRKSGQIQRGGGAHSDGADHP